MVSCYRRARHTVSYPRVGITHTRLMGIAMIGHRRFHLGNIGWWAPAPQRLHQTAFQGDSLGVWVACVLTMMGIGCVRPAAPPVVTANDQKIASDCVRFVENSLRSLPEDHPLIQRYGKLTSVKIGPIQRNGLSKGARGESGFPPHLSIAFRCDCERFPATIAVTVLNYGSTDQIAYFHQSEPFQLVPLPEMVNTGTLADCEPVLRDGDLWYVRVGDDQTAIRSAVACWIQHPGFRP